MKRGWGYGVEIIERKRDVLITFKDLGGKETDGDFTEPLSGPGGASDDPVHGQIHVIVDGARSVALAAQLEQLEGVEVEKVDGVVGPDQVVSNVQRDGRVGVDGDEVGLRVHQPVASACWVIAPVDVQRFVLGVYLGVVRLAASVSRCRQEKLQYS